MLSRLNKSGPNVVGDSVAARFDLAKARPANDFEFSAGITAPQLRRRVSVFRLLLGARTVIPGSPDQQALDRVPTPRREQQQRTSGACCKRLSVNWDDTLVVPFRVYLADPFWQTAKTSPDGTTLAMLGITHSTYTWTWGGATEADQSFTIDVISSLPFLPLSHSSPPASRYDGLIRLAQEAEEHRCYRRLSKTPDRISERPPQLAASFISDARPPTPGALLFVCSQRQFDRSASRSSSGAMNY